GQRRGSAVRAPTGPGPGGDAPGTARPPGDESTVRRRDDPESRTGTGETAGEQPTGPAVVPAQRGDDPNAPTDPATPTGTAPGQPAEKAGPDGPGGSAPGQESRGADGPAGTGRSAPARRPVLTEREMQVLVGMADGKSNAEIGRELFVSEDTVKTHARRLFRKLGARDRAHAVAAGFRAGLVA
ncbi:response regulator transcription factor, partial [Plantactinospora mayteni]